MLTRSEGEQLQCSRIDKGVSDLWSGLLFSLSCGLVACTQEELNQSGHLRRAMTPLDNTGIVFGKHGICTCWLYFNIEVQSLMLGWEWLLDIFIIQGLLLTWLLAWCSWLSFHWTGDQERQCLLNISKKAKGSKLPIAVSLKCHCLNISL